MSIPFHKTMGLIGLTATLLAGAAGICRASGIGDDDQGATQLYDDFRDGFSATRPTDKWFYFSAGPFVGNGGIETTGNQGLRVVANGVNLLTGEPAFINTVVPESHPLSLGLPGGVDHVKWLVYTHHPSSHGFPGFDATLDRQVGCEAWVGGRTFGTGGHPFAGAVANPNDDLRLAAFAMNTIDFETFMVFDFFMTDEGIYAFYERLPFGRGPVLGDYAAFSFAKRVADNEPGKLHKLGISYSRASNTVTWKVDGSVVQRVGRLGLPIDRSQMIIDHGGTPTEVTLNQLACGMGMFTLLDADLWGRGGLVKLSTAPDFYFDPAAGPPTSQVFTDEDSLDSSRLFGQGAEILVKKYNVTHSPN